MRDPQGVAVEQLWNAAWWGKPLILIGAQSYLERIEKEGGKRKRKGGGKRDKARGATYQRTCGSSGGKE